MKALPILVATGALVAAGLAIAHSPSPNASCSAVHDESDTLHLLFLHVPLVFSLAPVGTFYAVLDLDDGLLGLQLWHDTNTWPGLQTHSHGCSLDAESEPVTLAADDRLL